MTSGPGVDATHSSHHARLRSLSISVAMPRGDQLSYPIGCGPFELCDFFSIVPHLVFVVTPVCMPFPWLYSPPCSLAYCPLTTTWIYLPCWLCAQCRW